MKTQKILALFDFDGTLTTKDSYLMFLIFSLGWFKFILKTVILLPIVVSYKLGLLSNSQTKEIMTVFYYAGCSLDQFDHYVKDFCSLRMKSILRLKTFEKFLDHINSGHQVVIVTASFENYLEPWCDQYKVQLVGTQLEVKEGKLTGGFKSANCYGEEKVRRIKQHVNLSEFDTIYAYGDSQSDMLMLSLAHKAFFVRKGELVELY